MNAAENPTPTHINFATEVKTDRLDLLWRVTLGFAFGILLLSITLMSVSEVSLVVWVLGPLVLVAFCFLTRFALWHDNLQAAALIYTSGTMLTTTVMLLDGSTAAFEIYPFLFVFIVFMAGMLLRPELTFVIAGLSSVITLLVPLLVSGDWAFLGGHQVFAILLMFLSAAMAAQVTGELYAVTEWALLNYQRERRTNLDLFESREALHKSLLRSEALSEQLQEKNVELKEAHAAAEAAKNFRGQFLANMSHELRTPLNAIIGFSETMLKFPIMYDNEPLPEAYTNDMNQIYNSGRQLLHLINDILDLAKVDAGKLEVYMQLVELQPVVDFTLTTAQGLIGSKPIELKANLPDTLPQIWADESRVRQVLLNLYSNAAKFTDEGSITLTMKVVNDEIQFAITDTGAGIASDQQETIFEEFKQAQAEGRDPRSGAGLGLTISRQLLTLMGGRIWVESEPGKGSTFYFTLQPYHKAKFATVERPAVKLPSALEIN